MEFSIMDKSFLCFIDMFDECQRFFDINEREKNFSIKTSNIQDCLPAICREMNTYHIHFYGNENYINGLIQQIRAKENTKFGKNELTFEVN